METLSDRIDLLKQTKLFENLSYEDAKVIAYTTTPRFFSDGEIVFEEGETGEEAFLITQGEVEIWKGAPGKNEVLIATIQKGELFGEMAIISEAPRTATVITKGEVRTLVINKEIFLDIIRDFPEVALGVMKTLVHRLITTDKLLVEAKQK